VQVVLYETLEEEKSENKVEEKTKKFEYIGPPLHFCEAFVKDYKDAYLIKEINFQHLECLILSKGLTEYHQLIKAVNAEWAHELGFQLKMR